MILAALALWIAAAAPAGAGLGLASPEEAAGQVAACGAGPASAHYEDEMGEYVVQLQPTPSATDEQLRCVADLGVKGGYLISVPPAMEERYRALESRLLDKLILTSAQDWAVAHDMVGKVPHYRKGTDKDRPFTGKLEKLCGPEAKGAFGSQYGSRVLAPAFIKRAAAGEVSSETLQCLFNVSILAGFPLGFVGNEAHSR
jgi:hypothetical protein